MRLRFPQRLGCLLALLVIPLFTSIQVRAGVGTNGYPVTWGANSTYNTPPTSLTNVVSVAAGHYHNVALLPDGTVTCWGQSWGEGELTPPTGLSGVKAVAAGEYFSVALKNDGTVVAWGNYSLAPAPAMTGIKSISAGLYHCLALGSNGMVYSWGSGSGNAGYVAGNIVAISAGVSHNMGLTSGGQVVCWGGYGSNADGQCDVPGSLVNVVGIAAGGRHSVALMKNGSMIAWGNNTYGQCSLSGITSVASIGAGYQHTLMLFSNKQVYAVGEDYSGQCDVPAMTNAVQIAAGYDHNLALRVNFPVITTQPTNLSILTGTTASFAVSATGSTPLVYQWRKDGVSITNETNATLTIPNAVATDAAAYSVTISNAIGGVVSSNATLTVNYKPFIITQPVGGTNRVGDGPRVFSVRASGTQPLTYRWLKDGITAPGPYPVDLTNYTIYLVYATNAGNYSVIITNPWGAITSTIATLTVYGNPYIVTQPTNQTVLEGSQAAFHVVATNATKYQWRKNGTNIPNATLPDYVISSTAIEDSGIYSVDIRNDYQYGQTISADATLVVYNRPLILQQPVSQTVVAGTNVTLSVTASNATTYLWFQNGTPLFYATSPTLVINNVQPGNAGNYFVEVRNSYPEGVTNSQSAILTVSSSVTITNQPQSQTAWPGTAISFSVACANATYYQWRKDGVNLDGANSSNLVLYPVQTSDAGLYSVLASNNAQGSITISSNAALSILNPTPPVRSAVLTLGQTSVWDPTPPGSWLDYSTPPGLGNLQGMAVGSHHGMALVSPGWLLSWGDTRLGQVPPTIALTNLLGIAAGSNHSLALLSNGTVYAWGANTLGQSTPPTNCTNISFITAGNNHSLAVRSNGTIVGWGGNDYGQSTPPKDATNNIRSAAAGNGFSVVLRSNGTVYAWGRNDESQSHVPSILTSPTTAGVSAIACGDGHTLALRSNGTVVVWGRNTSGQTNTPVISDAVAIAAGDNHCLALRGNGSAIGWGNDNWGQIDGLNGLTNVIAIAAGGNRSLLVLDKQLILQTPQRRLAGGCVLYIQCIDGSAVESNRLPGVEIRATTNVLNSISAWAKYTNGLVLTNGLIRWEDSNPLKARYYKVGEQQ